MKNHKIAVMALGSLLVLLGAALAEDSGKMVKVPAEKARVFVTDSQSWEVSSGGGGTSGGFGTAGGGGARPQTAQILKTFSERCPDATVNNICQKTDYIVVLEHERGKSRFNHRDKDAGCARAIG